MNEFLYNFINKFDFPLWVLSSLLWVMLTGFVVGVVKMLWVAINAIIISRKLLKSNRNTKGNGYGKYFADRFLEIWYSASRLVYNHKATHRADALFPKYFLVGVAEEELLKLGLITISESHKESKKLLLPVKNLRNKLIVGILKFYLVHLIGDSPDYYKQLKKSK
jgi:hypothetical protein